MYKEKQNINVKEDDITKVQCHYVECNVAVRRYIDRYFYNFLPQKDLKLFCSFFCLEAGCANVELSVSIIRGVCE